MAFSDGCNDYNLRACSSYHFIFIREFSTLDWISWWVGFNIRDGFSRIWNGWSNDSSNRLNIDNLEKRKTIKRTSLGARKKNSHFQIFCLLYFLSHHWITTTFCVFYVYVMFREELSSLHDIISSFESFFIHIFPSFQWVFNPDKWTFLKVSTTTSIKFIERPKKFSFQFFFPFPFTKFRLMWNREHFHHRRVGNDFESAAPQFEFQMNFPTNNTPMSKREKKFEIIKNRNFEFS